MPTNPDEETIKATVVALGSYYEAVGKVVHAWNGLQEQFAAIYCRVKGVNNSAGLKEWYATQSDRKQRQMLRDSLGVVGEKWLAQSPKGKEDITWLLGKADSLAHRRNDVIHAPCTVVFNPQSELEIMPLSSRANPLGKALRGRSVLDEFARYEKDALALKLYAQSIDGALADPNFPWPEKPNLE
jgi:hypothetical protein